MLLQEGLSALMLCCEEGNSEMAELLLNSHADPNLQHPVMNVLCILIVVSSDCCFRYPTEIRTVYPSVSYLSEIYGIYYIVHLHSL